MKKFRLPLLIIAYTLIFSVASFLPPSEALAKEKHEIQGTCVANKEICSSVHIYDDDSLVINGQYFSINDINDALKDAYVVKDRFAAVAAAPVVSIPGIGEVLLIAGGAIIIAGVVYYGGSYIAKAVHSWLASHSHKGKQKPSKSPHRTNKQKKNWNKHTKPRAGRTTEKKRQNPKWKKRK